MQKVGQCPDCQAWFQAAVEKTDRVRCPHCSSTLSISQIRFQELLPLQPLQDAPTVPIASGRQESTSVSIEAAAAAPQIDESDPGPSRSRRRNKNPIWEVTKIAAGGVAGLLIAQLILWWLPGDLRRDPFRLAPHVPKWLHVILPEDLQPAHHSQRLTRGEARRDS